MYLSVLMINYYKFSVLYDFFELLIFWYNGAMETPQHGNASTWKRTPKNGNLPKMFFFEAFPVFSKIFGNSLNLSFRGVSHFFDPFPRFLDSGLFPNIFEGFLKKVLKSQFVDWFPLFLDPFPHFLGRLHYGCSWRPGFPSLVTPSSETFREYFIKSVEKASEVNLQKF